MTEQRTALVAGATGVTGTPLAEALLVQGWRVVALSRRAPMLRSDVPTEKLVHIEVDLGDAGEVRRRLGAQHEVSHVFYCGNDSRAEVRFTMLRNVLDAVEPAAAQLANVHLMQGNKYYGCHLGPFKVPAQESDPRIPGADFYYGEEDFVRARRHGKRWTWTALRSHAVCGYAAGNPVNLAIVLGIYASLCKALGRPLAFPATQACFEARFNVVDADLLARAAIWCSTNAGCGDQAFNVNNGDVFRWCDLWPRLAHCFDLPVAGPQRQPLSEFLVEHAGLWQTLTRRHGLENFPYERLARWIPGDYCPPNSRFACEYDVHADLSKLRRHGFGERVDSAQMFADLFVRARRERVIP